MAVISGGQDGVLKAYPQQPKILHWTCTMMHYGFFLAYPWCLMQRTLMNHSAVGRPLCLLQCGDSYSSIFHMPFFLKSYLLLIEYPRFHSIFSVFHIPFVHCTHIQGQLSVHFPLLPKHPYAPLRNSIRMFNIMQWYAMCFSSTFPF